MPNLFLNQNRFNIVNGFAFEILVLNNIHLILKELGLYSKIQKNQNYELIKYNNLDSQIDLIIDHKTNFYSLVECKFYNDVYVLERQEENKIYNRFDQISKNNKFSNKKNSN